LLNFEVSNNQKQIKTTAMGKTYKDGKGFDKDTRIKRVGTTKPNQKPQPKRTPIEDEFDDLMGDLDDDFLDQFDDFNDFEDWD